MGHKHIDTLKAMMLTPSEEHVGEGILREKKGNCRNEDNVCSKYVEMRLPVIGEYGETYYADQVRKLPRRRANRLESERWRSAPRRAE